jgi:hypothetical protein
LEPGGCRFHLTHAVPIGISLFLLGQPGNAAQADAYGVKKLLNSLAYNAKMSLKF